MTFVDTLHFWGSKSQTFRYRAYCEVNVGGTTYNSGNPFLISVRVRDSASFEAWVELDDRDGRLEIPAYGTEFTISLGWWDPSERIIRVFNGTLNEIWHGFGRKHGGRRMWLKGDGFNALSNIKTLFQDHVGEQGSETGQMEGPPIPFVEAASKFVGNGGATIEVGPTFQGTVRDYWQMDNESPMNWVSRHAEELGAWHRVEGGTQMKFYGRDDLMEIKPKLTALWGDNLISWKIRPFAAKPTWASGLQQYYDHQLGQWQQVVRQFKLPATANIPAQAVWKLPAPAPNRTVANQQLDGEAARVNWEFGDGRIMINGEPNVGWGSEVELVGARPGVDGIYQVETAEHTYSRQGYVTMLEVRPVTPTAGTTGGIPLQTPTGTAAQQLTQQVNEPPLIVGGVPVTEANGALIPGIWNETAVNDARLEALNTGNPDPLAGLETLAGESAPPPIGAGP